MTPIPSLATIASTIPAYDAQSLKLADASAFIARLVTPISTVERVGLRASLGRVLAQDIQAPFDVPTHDNSAMDGYALRGTELNAGADSVFAVAATALAGHAVTGATSVGHCVRIMTGATMPTGLDTVVPQELTTTDADGRVRVPAGAVRAGEHRRVAGEDLARGSVALCAGRLLRPADLGLLASLGQAEVPVHRRLRVAFFSTGDELRSLGEPLPPGCVYDSNRYTLWAMLTRLGFDVIDLGVVADNEQALEAAFLQAAACADVVITSGGVSVGEADHTKAVMARLGDVLFWRVAMRPGRPLAIGRLNVAGQSALLFGLPGNPVAVMVSFYALVRDALLQMAGATPNPLPLLRAVATREIRKKAGRTEFPRGFVSLGPQGWQVDVDLAQGSGILRSMSQANGLVVLAHGQASVRAGDLVDVLPFDGLV